MTREVMGCTPLLAKSDQASIHENLPKDYTRTSAKKKRFGGESVKIY